MQEKYHISGIQKKISVSPKMNYWNSLIKTQSGNIIENHIQIIIAQNNIILILCNKISDFTNNSLRFCVEHSPIVRCIKILKTKN